MVITRRNVSRGGVGWGGAGKLSLRPREGRIAMILFKDVLKHIWRLIKDHSDSELRGKSVRSWCDGSSDRSFMG